MLDSLIIWSGPAWLSAAIYAKRYEMNIQVVWELFGWTVTKTHLIENWPWTKSTSWFELWMNLMEHAKSIWVDVKMWKVTSVTKNSDWTFTSILQNWDSIDSKTIIYATWSKHRELWLESEHKLKNKWVSYCATCDWWFFKDNVVWIVWWSDSAVKESLLLATYATKVYIIYRKETPRAEPINMKRMRENDKIEVIWNSNVIEVLWETAVTWVKLDTGKTLDLEGLFIEIWSDPIVSPLQNDSLKDLELTNNTIVTDKFWRTNIDWLFAAWDVTDNPFRQAIVSASEWAHCANQVFEYINE